MSQAYAMNEVIEERLIIVKLMKRVEAARIKLKTMAHEWGALRFYLVIPEKGSKMRKWSVTVISNQTGNL